jgi:predicted aspartyl protease
VKVKNTVWAVLSLAILFSASGSAAKTHKANTPSGDADSIQQESIPVNVYNGFLVVTTGQIGGLAERQNFVLDTGTAPSILNERSAKSLGLPVSRGILVAVGQAVSTGQTVLPQLDLGPIHVTNLPMNVMDLSQLEKRLGMHVAGLIGMDVLGRSSFCLDYQAKELRFGDAEEQGIGVPYDQSTGLALAEATLQGRRVRLIVDTGSDLVVVYGGDWSKEDTVRPVSESEGTSVAEQVAARQIANAELAFGGKEFRVMRAYYIPSATKVTYDGFFGVRALKLRGISFDRESQTMYLLN